MISKQDNNDNTVAQPLNLHDSVKMQSGGTWRIVIYYELTMDFKCYKPFSGDTKAASSIRKWHDNKSHSLYTCIFRANIL